MIFILQKIPRCAVPDDLAQSGPVTVRFHRDVSVVGSYNVLFADDGRVRICCWKNFINQVTWLIIDPLDVMTCCGRRRRRDALPLRHPIVTILQSHSPVFHTLDLGQQIDNKSG